MNLRQPQPDRGSPLRKTQPYPIEFRPGHRLRLLRDGTNTFPAILSAIAAAKRSVEVEQFIFSDDPTGHLFAEALGERAAAGVRVRVIIDRVGSLMTLRLPIGIRLRQLGVAIRPFRPFRPRYLYRIGWRDHRKLVICDGKTAFVGGFCFDDRWAGDSYDGDAWRDTGVQVSGPVVSDFLHLFEARWTRRYWTDTATPELPSEDRASDGGGVVAATLADTPIRHPVLDFYLRTISAAKREVWIANAYLVPPGRLRAALRAAAVRGVDVRILVPGRCNHAVTAMAGQRFYASLMRDGVRIYRWSGRMMHAKTAVVDGQLGIVGSSNLDYRSLMAAHDLNVAFRDETLGVAMRQMFLEDLARSDAVEYADWIRRPLHIRALSLAASALRRGL